MVVCRLVVRDVERVRSAPEVGVCGDGEYEWERGRVRMVGRDVEGLQEREGGGECKCLCCHCLEAISSWLGHV